jgi:hypothetical protein
MNDTDREKIIDRRVQARLATDAAYRNAENAEEQAEREDEITRQEEHRLRPRPDYDPRVDWPERFSDGPY